MKKISLLLLLTIFSAFSCTKIKPQGEIITIHSVVSSTANKISVGNAVKLVLSDQINPGELLVTTHQNIHNYIVISDESGALEITLKDEKYRPLDIQIVVSSKQYSNIQGSGACSVIVEGAPASFDDYTIDLSGVSMFMGKVAITDQLQLNLSGGSRANISGTAAQCQADLSGMSESFGTALECNTLNVDMSGSSKITMSVVESITGEISGQSKIRYSGSAVVSVKASGSSSVEQI